MNESMILVTFKYRNLTIPGSAGLFLLNFTNRDQTETNNEGNANLTRDTV